MFAEILLTLAIGLISYSFYKWAVLNNNYFKKRGIKSLKPTFLLGNMYGFFFNKFDATEFSSMLYNSFPTEKIFGIFDFRIPLWVARDPDLIKQLAVKDFDHFEDHRSFIEDNTDVLFGNSLFMMRGEKWRNMRATLSPAFTSSKMKQMFELVAECANDMTSELKKKSEKGEKLVYEMKDLFALYTNDVIASCAFGLKVNSIENPDNEFLRSGRFFSNAGLLISLRMLLLRSLPFIARLFNIQFFPMRTVNFFRNVVLDTMNERTRKNIFRPDVINLLMQVRQGELTSDVGASKGDAGFATVEESDIGKKVITRKWTDDELVAQCFLFFLAGFDTASTFMVFCTYELCVNQEIQQKLFDEVKETDQKLGGRNVDYDTLQKMKYLDQVICETLRKWPPAVQTDRLCVKDYTYEQDGLSFRIEKGSAFWIPIYGLHHDENYFPNPEKFDPERFSDENRNDIQPGTYIPFGTGPRNCIGNDR